MEYIQQHAPFYDERTQHFGHLRGQTAKLLRQVFLVLGTACSPQILFNTSLHVRRQIQYLELLL